MKSKLIFFLIVICQIALANIKLPAKITVAKQTFYIGESIDVRLVICNPGNIIADYLSHNLPQHYIIKNLNANKILNLNWKTSAGSRKHIFPGDSVVYIR